jgi:predicted lipid-binding transport protein (Tim44 family)
MGGLASVLGLILQIALIVIVARLLFAWWQRRQMPAPAYAGANRATSHSLGGLGSMFVGGTSSGEPLTIGKSDYDSFESLLGEIQSAYSAEDINALRTKVTPEMLSYFSEQLAENASRGLVNKIDGVRLEQGDLSESWREGQVEYATVAMRFGLTDRMVDRVTGRTVEGGSPVEATELWTFMRAPDGKWVLSAIQQT